jgi:hypothetical protein
MAAINPFANDPEKEKYEKKAIWPVLNQPDLDDFPPYTEELLEIYTKGQAEGHNDKATPLDDDTHWCSVDDIPESSKTEEISEFWEHVLVHGVFGG